MQEVLFHISQEIGEDIVSHHPISGGDISSAYLLQTETKKYFLKVNSKPFASAMFHAEQKGLQAIGKTQTIAVPHVHLVDSAGGKLFLLMDFVEAKRPDAADFRRFGEQLAQLHQCAQSNFGFLSDNFIGSLPQSNHPHTDWAVFYWYERIFPQLKMACDRQLLNTKEIPTHENALPVFNEIFGNVNPSLLHGDLWAGNYLISTDRTPYLIDPATYCGHAMVDIAMSRLFGGFGPSFYDAYHGIIPKTGNYQQQIELYQLYYLLVHLNLFGKGYYSGVLSILQRYF